LVHEQLTQELRLNSTLFDGYADTTLGLFYLTRSNEDARVDLPYAGLDFLHGPDITPSTARLFTDSRPSSDGPHGPTLGVRYSRIKRAIPGIVIIGRHTA
jgi:iron complex outermembrane receptor protein